MKQQRSARPVIVGVVVHLPPEFIADFKNYIESFPHVRIIIYRESNNKLWLIEREDRYD